MTPKKIAENLQLLRQDMASCAFELGVQLYRAAILLERASSRFNPWGKTLRMSADQFDRIKQIAEGDRTLEGPKLERLGKVFEAFAIELTALIEIAKEIPETDTVTLSVLLDDARRRIDRMGELRTETQIILDLRFN